jgi:hypothetical protein
MMLTVAENLMVLALTLHSNDGQAENTAATVDISPPIITASSIKQRFLELKGM